MRITEEMRLELTDIFGVYSDPSRILWDRISVKFIARIISGDAKAEDDAESIQLLPLDDQTNLAFDHNKILKDYQQWKKTKIRVIKNIASEIKRFYFMVSIL